MNMQELNRAANRLRQIMNEVDTLQAEADAIRDAIKAAMVERGEEAISGEGWNATWHAVTTHRLDTAALKANEPGIYDQYSHAKTVCRFVFT